MFIAVRDIRTSVDVAQGHRRRWGNAATLPVWPPRGGKGEPSVDQGDDEGSSHHAEPWHFDVREGTLAVQPGMRQPAQQRAEHEPRNDAAGAIPDLERAVDERLHVRKIPLRRERSGAGVVDRIGLVGSERRQRHTRRVPPLRGDDLHRARGPAYAARELAGDPLIRLSVRRYLPGGRVAAELHRVLVQHPLRPQ